MAVGFDDLSTEVREKHYRLKLPKTLEESVFFSEPPFETLEITRGKKINLLKGGINNSMKNYSGVFKAKIEISTKKDKKEYEDKKREYEIKKYSKIR